MTLLVAGKVNYRARLERSELLARRFTFAREILGFYQQVARFQKEFHEQLPKLWGKRGIAPAGGKLRSELNLTILLEPFDRFLGLIEMQSPGPLAAHSRQLRSRGTAAWENVLGEFWKTGLLEADASEPKTEFLARAFLQPYAEFLATALLPPVLPMTVCRCPRCNSLPLLGLLRPEGDGGKRFLQCSFCSQEWEFRRILCAHCGEEREQKLPVYVAEQFAHVRVECCDTCKKFLRTIDLTKDGNAVPLVDDLAAIPLTLWAEENGYSRIQSNLLGT
ncbi:MAG: formate dehydrogenase accessory protein FdhE [Candidatus Acidiferrum sp.]